MKEPIDPAGRFIHFPKEAVEASIPQRFQDVVSQQPDHIALEHGDETMTYGELHRASELVASAILTQRGAAEEPVVLLLDRGIPPIVALLGVLQAGKGYVALRPSDPQARLMHIATDLGARLIIANDQTHPLALTLADRGLEILNLDRLEAKHPVRASPSGYSAA